jgi:hypothetical protein
MRNSIYFENYCLKIYNFIFTYINFIIGIKLFAVLGLYYIFKAIKHYKYLFLIDDFVLYYIHSFTVILLLIRLLYAFYIKKKINLLFYNIKNLTYEIYSLYIITINNLDMNDIDDSYSNTLAIQNYENHVNISERSYENNFEAGEFKDLILFYISYFVSMVVNLNYENDIYQSNYLFDCRIFENFIVNNVCNKFYNYNINNFPFKLHIIEFNIKLLLNKSFHNGIISSVEYTLCSNYLKEINKSMNDIYLYLDYTNVNTNKENLNFSLFLGLYNQKNIYIKMINVLNDILIFLSIVFTIIYYLNYLSDIAIIYILIIAFSYLYINLLIYLLLNNQVTNQNNNQNYISFNIDNYNIDLYKLLVYIHDEINTLFQISTNKINIIYK